MQFPKVKFRGRSSLAMFLLPVLLGQSPQMGPAATPPRNAAPSGPEGTTAMPADRAEDSYAIYSLLMPGEEFASMAPEENANWAIADITVNEQDRNPAIPPQGQLTAPPDHARRFQEAVADYNVNRNVRIQLTKKDFHIGHPFSLLTRDQVDELRAAKAAPDASSEVQSRWAGYPGITFFSEVYFDRRHTAALVYMNDWCAHLCAAGSWIYLEKQNGQWQRRSGIIVPGA